MKTDKLLAIAAFIFLGLALWVIVDVGPATGYEISIYAAYPPYFWFFLVASMACGIYILVRNAFSENQSRWWATGLTATLLANGVLLLLPFFRGYFAHGFFDPLNQIGLVRDIQLTKHFGAAGTPGENFYPPLHILASSLSDITGLTAEVVLQIIPPVFFVFYIVSIYLMSQLIMRNKGKSLLITAFGMLPMITSSNESLTAFVPRIETFLLLPFVLYLYYRARVVSSSATAYTSLFVIILVIMPFFHPYDGGLFLILVFLCIDISLWIYRRLTIQQASEPNTVFPTLAGRSIIPCLLVISIWFMWFSTFSMFYSVVRGLADWLVYHIGKSEAERYLFFLGRADVPLNEAVELFLKIHGHHLMYCMASGVVTVITWWKLLFSRNKADLSLVVFSFLFVVWVILLVVSFFISLELGYTRFISYAVFTSAIVDGVGVYLLFQRFRRKKLLTLATMVFLVVPVALGVLNSYGSPFIAGYNNHVTMADMKGMGWFLEKRDEALIADQITLTQYNHTSALLGRGSIPKNIRGAYLVEASMLEHFGYPEYPSYGAAIKEDRYFLSHRLDWIVYSERIPEYEAAWRWSPADFDRLEGDSTVNRIYTSGEFEVFYVKSTNER